MSRRSATLELAVLGLLHDAPMHGYELRKRLNAVLGVFRPLSYGTLYPCLRGLLERGWIRELPAHSAPRTGRQTASARRGRIVYELTPDGKDHFQALLTEAGPAAWEDDSFDVHFAFFARTEQTVRLRILEGRRSRLEERLDQFRKAAQRGRERVDAWTAELQRHGLESTEREVRWLSELIDSERRAANARSRHTPGGRDRAAHGDHRTTPDHPKFPENPDNKE